MESNLVRYGSISSHYTDSLDDLPSLQKRTKMLYYNGCFVRVTGFATGLGVAGFKAVVDLAALLTAVSLSASLDFAAWLLLNNQCRDCSTCFYHCNTSKSI
jgi:hypothetical protein